MKVIPLVNKSTLRVAAAAMAIACATAADAQQGERAVIEARVQATPATVEQSLVEPVRLAQAMPIAATGAQSARLPDAAGWTPLLVLFGVLALIGAFLLMTRQGLRRAPWESDETEASTARGRERRLLKEMRTRIRDRGIRQAGQARW